MKASIGLAMFGLLMVVLAGVLKSSGPIPVQSCLGSRGACTGRLCDEPGESCRPVGIANTCNCLP